MSGDDLKTLVAVLAVMFTGASLSYTILRNRSQDRAGSMAVLVEGWDNRVKELASSLESCENGRREQAAEIEALKKSTAEKIAAVEDEAVRMRLETRRDNAALYRDNDNLRARVRELESRWPPGDPRRPPTP